MKSKVIAVIAMVAMIVLPVHGAINPIVTEVTLESGGYLCLDGAAKVVTFTIDSGSADLAWGGVDDEGNGIPTDKIEVRDSAGVLVSSPYQVSANGTVSVKGVKVSDALEDVHMTLTGHHSDPVLDVTKTVKFTVIKVESITVRPKDTPVDYELPEPVCIGAGAIESDAHQADVTIQVIPQEEGIPISVSLLNGRGHGAAGAAEEDIPHAKLVMGSATATGSKEAVTVETSAGGKIEGVLTSSDVINDCTIHTCTKERLVKFTWDTYSEEGEWTTDLDVLPVPGVLENYLTLRHHRADADDAPWEPLNGHEIRFFVEKVEYLDAQGVIAKIDNLPTAPNPLIDDWAHFQQPTDPTDANGRVRAVLTVENKPDVWCVYMAAYDWTVWKAAASRPAPLGSATITFQEAQAAEPPPPPPPPDPRLEHETKPEDKPVIELDIGNYFKDRPFGPTIDVWYLPEFAAPDDYVEAFWPVAIGAPDDLGTFKWEILGAKGFGALGINPGGAQPLVSTLTKTDDIRINVITRGWSDIANDVTIKLTYTTPDGKFTATCEKRVSVRTMKLHLVSGAWYTRFNAPGGWGMKKGMVLLDNLDSKEIPHPVYINEGFGTWESIQQNPLENWAPCTPWPWPDKTTWWTDYVTKPRLTGDTPGVYDYWITSWALPTDPLTEWQRVTTVPPTSEPMAQQGVDRVTQTWRYGSSVSGQGSIPLGGRLNLQRNCGFPVHSQ